MSGNSKVLVVVLPRSDGFHTRNDAHLAEIAKRAVEKALEEGPLRGDFQVLITATDKTQEVQQ